MNRRFALVVAVLAAFLAAAGCSSKEEVEKPKPATMGKPAVSVDAVKAATGDVVEGIEVTGTLSPKYQAEIKPEYGGVVTHVYVNDWAKVRKGDPLLKVDTREGEVLLQKAKAAIEMAKAGLMEAEAADSRADREYDRAVKLQESGLLTRQGMDDARTQKEAAAARIAAAKAQVAVAGEDVAHATTRLSKAVIRSPFDGTVAERLVSAGDLVGEMQKVVFRLVDNRLLELTVNVPSTEMAALRVGQPVRFSTDAFPGREFDGKVAHINPSVSPGDRSVRVIAEVPNVPEVLKGGLFVKGRIATGVRKGVVQVPRTALLSWNVAARKGEVFVVDNNVARRRGVTTGAVQGDRVEIPSGLRSGETVVTRGAFLLSDGDAVKVAAAAK
ncbi:MAG TPA: efflux RND transporter periplasmic adaptor subunit [Thermodesulfobacteriota bacterium]|nr:MAG: efflux transporter periplasmic adaptor subunit [Deltaproteobacteria bacterium 21-66-5]HQU13418.1 efflux RND transporter periplasmic adaptor subunit [Thermodesulfobacteriota bacterium]